MFEKIFHLKENHTDVKTEVMAGITTFMTMAYILAVNPSILSASGMDANAVLIATSLASFVGTALMALLANYPFALAPGMGTRSASFPPCVTGSTKALPVESICVTIHSINVLRVDKEYGVTSINRLSSFFSRTSPALPLRISWMVDAPMIDAVVAIPVAASGDCSSEE